MEEKAHIFFSLLNESYKQDAGEKLQLISVATVPHLKKGDASSIINSYRMINRDIIEETKPADDYSGIDRLKKIFKGK